MKIATCDDLPLCFPKRLVNFSIAFKPCQMLYPNFTNPPPSIPMNNSMHAQVELKTQDYLNTQNPKSIPHAKGKLLHNPLSIISSFVMCFLGCKIIPWISSSQKLFSSFLHSFSILFWRFFNPVIFKKKRYLKAFIFIFLFLEIFGPIHFHLFMRFLNPLIFIFFLRFKNWAYPSYNHLPSKPDDHSMLWKSHLGRR